MSNDATCNSSQYRYMKLTLEDMEYFKTPLVVDICFNAILGITATFGNLLIIVAILRSQSLQKPSYLLITSLAFTDLLVGLVYHPISILLYIFYLKTNAEKVCSLDQLADAITIPLASLSLNMSAYISIDRYLALRLKHRYRHVVTKMSVKISIVVTWLTFPPFVIALQNIQVIKAYWQTICGCVAFLQLSITCSFYIMSFVTLHRYTSHQVNPSQGNFDVVKYKKTLNIMVSVLGCFILCFIPAILSYTIVFPIFGATRLTVTLSRFCFTILGLNSSINPVIYLTFFKDIRKACKEMLGHS